VVRVAFDEQIFAVQRHGGISRVFAELAREFETDPGHGVALQPVAAPIVNEYVLADAQTAAKLVVRPGVHWSFTIARSMFRRRHHGPADIVHSSFYLPRMLKDYPQAKRVVTVYDMIPELFPQTRRRLDLLTRKHEYVRRSDHIICISESTKRDLLRIYPDVNVPVSVVHLGVGPEFDPELDPLPGLPSRYIIHVGHRGGYKDALTLYRAFARIHREFPDIDLLMVGGGPVGRSESQAIARLGIGGRVHQRSMNEREVAQAYANAELMVFPSRYEGFGLPVIEAMACGVPTILCNSSSLPEVGGEAALYFEIGDDARLAELIGDALTDHDMRHDLVTKSLKRATEFTWQRTAARTAEVYRRVIGFQ
jgi:glycosyltransferase involved in cell wall biosynthesis